MKFGHFNKQINWINLDQILKIANETAKFETQIFSVVQNFKDSSENHDYLSNFNEIDSVFYFPF